MRARVPGFCLSPPGSPLAPTLAAALWTLAGPLSAQDPPPGYYDDVDTTNAATLRATLHDVIDDHTRFPYTAGSTDTWNILEQADEDPNNASRIIDVYRNESFAKQGGGNPFYNREHTWPSSYGFPNDVPTNYPYTDCHLLRLCDDGYNSCRSNKPFRYCSATCSEKTTDVNCGQGGGSGTYPGNSNWSSGAFSSGTFEVWIGKRGDIARGLLYADVRYEGGIHGVTSAPEPDLILTDDDALIDASNTGQNESVAYMGILTVLLQWHLEDPVDDKERERNDVVGAFQGNRNPFVDHPEWVDILWGGAGNPSPTPWINEFHYDNIGNDTNELVEIAGPRGFDLSGWSLIGYDGLTGLMYKTVLLSGTIPDEDECIGALSFDFSGAQNGAPDGIALVDDSNQVVQFLSYEGTFAAVDGPAAGMASVGIGPFESGSTPEGRSLQLGGAGNGPTAFFWQAAQTSTFGSENINQTFNGGCASFDEYGCGANPAGSLAVVSGTPAIGTNMTIGVDNPLGTQNAGSLTFLFFSLAPDPNFPCGTLLSTFGMGGPFVPGELLVNLLPPDPALVLNGPIWTGPGTPAPIPFTIPNDFSFVGGPVYAQGFMLDPSLPIGEKFGLTVGIELIIGP